MILSLFGNKLREDRPWRVRWGAGLVLVAIGLRRLPMG